jgi:hypothetical protein
MALKLHEEKKSQKGLETKAKKRKRRRRRGS